MSKTVNKSFISLAKKIKKKIKPKKILEIGSNDSSFLKNFNKKKTVGIEPCSNIEKETRISCLDQEHQRYGHLVKFVWHLLFCNLYRETAHI